MSDKITTFPVLQPINTTSNGSVFSPSGSGGGVGNVSAKTGFDSQFTGDLYSSRGRFGNGTDYWNIDATAMKSANYEAGVSGCCIFYNGNVEFNEGTFRGDITAANIDLTGGVIRYKKTSFTDSTNAGYYISSEGVYFGSAADATKFKFTISDGSIDLAGSISGRSTITLAAAIDSAGHFADNAISTASSQILGSFTFGASGALQIGTYSAGVTGDIRISPTGILGRDKDNNTTFSINATTGVAVLNGLVVGTNVGLGTAKDSAGVTVIIGNTVTTGFVNALNVNAATVSASISITSPTITGGTITIGTGNNVFIAGANGIQLGHATFGSSPFRVSMAGEMTCTSGTFSGALSAATGTFSGSLTVGTALDIAVSADFPPDTNLVAYWGFDEGSGTTAFDGSDTKNNLTITNAVYQAGVKGNSLYFDGDVDYCTLGTNITFGANYTMSFWAKIQDKDYLGFVASQLGYYGYLRFGASAGEERNRIYGETDTDGDAIVLDFDSPIVYDTWYHFAISQDGSKVWRVYINGVLQTDTSTTTNASMTIARLGNGRSSTDYFKGNLDDFRIYSSLLTDAQIYSLYKNPGQGKSLAVPVGRLTSGYIYSKQIRVMVAPNTGDSYIAFGDKTDFDATNAGAILGCDDSDSDKFKMYIVNSTSKYFYYDGADLKMKGGSIVAPEFQTADDGTNRMEISSGTDSISLRWKNAANALTAHIKGNITDDRLEFSVASGGALYWDASKQLVAPSGTGALGSAAIPWDALYVDTITSEDLSGTGTRTVVANAGGVLSTVAQFNATCGTDTWASTDDAGNQIITHNLGVIPKLIKITAQATIATHEYVTQSIGSAAGDVGQCVYHYTNDDSAGQELKTNQIVFLTNTGETVYVKAHVVTADTSTTEFTLHWEDSGEADPMGIIHFLWEVIG